MSVAVAILASLGGVVAFLGMLFVIVKSVFRQVNATEDNTKALNELSEQIKGMADQLNDHETRISVVERTGWPRSGRNTRP